MLDAEIRNWKLEIGIEHRVTSNENSYEKTIFCPFMSCEFGAFI